MDGAIIESTEYLFSLCLLEFQAASRKKRWCDCCHRRGFMLMLVMDGDGLGVRLGRLLADRKVDAVAVAAAGVPLPELEAVLDGGNPESSLLRRLAPALGFPAADLFVIAGVDLPNDLACWDTDPDDVGSILGDAAAMPPELRRQVIDFISASPTLPVAEPAKTRLKGYPGSGAMLLRLLMNRNIRPWHGAQLLRSIGDAEYVASATVMHLSTNPSKLTPRYVTAFAHVLGYSPSDLAALSGVGPPADNRLAHADRAELAKLAWDARRLNPDQLRQAAELAGALRRNEPRYYCRYTQTYLANHGHG